MSAQPPGRIPFENIVSAKSWLIPEVNGNVINGDEQRKRKTQVGKNKSSQQKRSLPEAPVKSEDVEAPAEPSIKGITASQLEEITKAAEQDGFEKGYDEGLEQGKVDGRKAGYSEGIKAGTEQAESEHGQWLKEQGAHLQQVCESLMAPLNSQQKELADATLDLAFGIARHILNCELIADPKKIIPIVDIALEALPPVEKNIVLYLHPDDAEAYKKYAPHALTAQAIQISSILERGSCQVKSEHSFVDYSVAHRINDFIASLAEKPFDEAAAQLPITPVERELSHKPVEPEALEPEAAEQDAIDQEEKQQRTNDLGSTTNQEDLHGDSETPQTTQNGDEQITEDIIETKFQKISESTTNKFDKPIDASVQINNHATQDDKDSDEPLASSLNTSVNDNAENEDLITHDTINVSAELADDPKQKPELQDLNADPAPSDGVEKDASLIPGDTRDDS